MSADVQELTAQRDLTRWFIEGNPASLVLVPYARVMQPSGQWKQQAGDPRPVQIMRVVEQQTTPGQAVIRLEDGTERAPDYMLVGSWNALVANGDRFVYQGTTVEVVQVDRTNQYETRASVVRRLDP